MPIEPNSGKSFSEVGEQESYFNSEVAMNNLFPRIALKGIMNQDQPIYSSIYSILLVAQRSRKATAMRPTLPAKDSLNLSPHAETHQEATSIALDGHNLLPPNVSSHGVSKSRA